MGGVKAWSEKVSSDWGRGFQEFTGHTARKAATKAAEEAAKASKAQQDILAKQEADLATKEEERLSRIKRKRQGRRSLLYSEGDEAGVRSDVLGG